MAKAVLKDISGPKAQDSSERIKHDHIFRETPEIVIGMVGPICAGVSYTAKVIESVLKDEYGYKEVDIIKMSDLIRDNLSLIGEDGNKLGGLEKDEEIIYMQDSGNNLRREFDGAILAYLGIKKIAEDRQEGGLVKRKIGGDVPIRRRKAIIVDSLKNLKEREVFKAVYMDIYWQFTVFASKEVRERRARDIGLNIEKIDKIFNRDDDEGLDYGQQVEKLSYLSDFFIRNDIDKRDCLEKSVKRFLEIMFGDRIHTPTDEEVGMYIAYSVATRSSCLSRKVGASLYSSKGDLIGVGHNDVPKYGGGLYGEISSKCEGKDSDFRCFTYKGFCRNSKRKSDLITKITSICSKDGKEKVCSQSLKDTEIWNILEYSRSIHAEMEAILSAARRGAKNMVGGTLFTTTFPCHNCARHIVAAGISKVIYMEPYPKSLALELHDDAITAKEGEGRNKVLFIQYEGVGPYSFMELFYDNNVKRKEKTGECIFIKKEEKRKIIPKRRPFMDDFFAHEGRVASELLPAILSKGKIRGED